MDKIKTMIQGFMAMPPRKKCMVTVSAAMTVFVAAAIPVYAWFSSQKKAAEMYKVEFPSSLYLNAAHREDQIWFDLGEINMNEYRRNYVGQWLDATGTPTDSKEQAGKITNMRYVFSVSGTSTTKYTLQLAHTTNNEFTYTIYQAKQYYYDKGTAATAEIDENDIVPAGTLDDNIIPYTLHPDSHTENPLLVIGDDVIGEEPEGVEKLYYVKGDTVTLWKMNDADGDGLGDMTVSATDATDQQGQGSTAFDSYYRRNYGTNENVQENAVPLYSQALCTASTNANKRFCDYYILEITWPNRSDHVESKETDLVYLSVERKS